MKSQQTESGFLVFLYLLIELFMYIKRPLNFLVEAGKTLHSGRSQG